MSIISWIILGLIAGFVGGQIVNSEGQVLLIYNAVTGRRRA